jgi:hypothetical protein
MTTSSAALARPLHRTSSGAKARFLMAGRYSVAVEQPAASAGDVDLFRH